MQKALDLIPYRSAWRQLQQRRQRGPFYLNLNNGAGNAWWNSGGDLSLAAAQLAVLLVVTLFARSICLSSSYNLAHPETLVDGKRRAKWFVAKESL